MIGEISGKVVRGDGYGKKLGFPTANIDRRQWRQRGRGIKLGVYAGLVALAGGNQYKAGIVIGPVDLKGLPKLEAHLIGYQGSLYGKRITFYLLKYLRPFKPYKSEALLRRQISQDIKRVHKLKL